MRSIFFHVRAERSTLAEFLNDHYQVTTATHWTTTAGALYIYFWDGFDQEAEAETLTFLYDAFGNGGYSSLCVDISGQIPGDQEVRDCVETLLGRYEGFAQDDYTDSLWSLAEIRSGALKAGHPFFAYEGWWAARPNRE